MFTWFRSPPHPHKRADDSVWMSDVARLKGVIAQSQERLRGGEKATIGAHSTATIQALKRACGDIAVEILEPHQLTPSRLAERAQGAASIFVALVGAMSDPDGEDKLLTQCKVLPFRITLQIHHSLPELVSTGIATDKLERQLKMLGVREDEAVSHKWVSRAISNARRKKKLKGLT